MDQKLISRFAVVAAVLLATTSAGAASSRDFYLNLLHRGISHVDAGQNDTGLRELRIAAFGFLDAIPQFETAHVYLAVAASRTGNDLEAKRSVQRIVSAERVERRYAAIALPDVIRRTFETVAAKTLSPDQLKALRSGVGALPVPPTSEPIVTRRPAPQPTTAAPPVQTAQGQTPLPAWPPVTQPVAPQPAAVMPQPAPSTRTATPPAPATTQPVTPQPVPQPAAAIPQPAPTRTVTPTTPTAQPVAPQPAPAMPQPSPTRAVNPAPAPTQPATTSTSTTSTPTTSTQPQPQPRPPAPQIAPPPVLNNPQPATTTRSPQPSTPTPQPMPQPPRPAVPAPVVSQPAPVPQPAAPPVTQPRPVPAPAKPVAPTPQPTPAVVQPSATPVPAAAAQDVATVIAQAEQKLAARDSLAAAAAFRDLADDPRLDHGAALRVGAGAARAEDFRTAVKAFVRAGSFAPGEDLFRYYYAVALYETGKYGAAKRELAAALPHLTLTQEMEHYRAKIEGAIE